MEKTKVFYAAEVIAELYGKRGYNSLNGELSERLADSCFDLKEIEFLKHSAQSFISSMPRSFYLSENDKTELIKKLLEY